jgi:biopolymer transport protein ExbD
MAMISSRSAAEPMMDINTTPLIDVMLVLLIMFIITIPMQTHAVKLDSPTNSPQPPMPIRAMNEIQVTADNRVLWNGAAVDLITLRQYLDQSQTFDPVPELHVRPDAHARYDLVDKVLAVAKHAHVTRMGIVGNDRYAHIF